MKDSDGYSLALKLVRADSENEVVEVLKEFNLWSDESAWQEISENKGNYSTIGNQQSTPEQALVEKIINSVDAVLMRECLERGIDPTSKKAPQSIATAQMEYFGIRDGKLSNIDVGTRSLLAENIYLIASGDKRIPSISLFDKGEGQEPEQFNNTFLALNRGNKNRIQFVQGKFGMGGTGALSFSSPKYNLQLIISKRNTSIKNEIGVNTGRWGLTVIRRNDPTSTMRSSYYTYLAPNKKIISFSNEMLPLIPTDKTGLFKKTKHGTYIKLYEYQLSTGRLRSDITRHLHNQLSLYMPDIALPIKVVDERYSKSPIKTLHGLSVRLIEDKREVLEPGFPSSGEISIQGQKMDFSIYAFKTGKKKDTYPKEEGVIFAVNGQAHAFLDRYFFERKTVDMGYLSDSILVTVDCSKLSLRTQEDLFMTSRDRMRSTPLRLDLESQLASEIKNNPGLKELREKRKREELEDKLSDSKPLQEVLQKMIINSPSLNNLLLHGGRLSNPFNFSSKSTSIDYVGKRFPTYFKLVKQYTEDLPKKCGLNKRCRIQFETDAENDYLTRDKEPGEFSLTLEGLVAEDYSMNLWNGLATLNITLPVDLVKIDDVLHFNSQISDISRGTPFTNDFFLKVCGDEEVGGSATGLRKDPPSDKKGTERETFDTLRLPEVIPVKKTEWDKYDFNDTSALKVKDLGAGEGYRFYVNVDNSHLLFEIKTNPKMDASILIERYKIGMLLLGISLLGIAPEDTQSGFKQSINEKGISIYNQVEVVSSAFSPYLLPMISTLGALSN